MPYLTDWNKIVNITNPNFSCNCGEKENILFRIWESSDEAHEDFNYKCNACGHSWWVEGSDY